MLGKTTLGVRTGRPESVGVSEVEWLPVGVTVAWDSVTAAVTASTAVDGTQVRIGEKVIERGTVMVPITVAEVQTATITGTPTGGAFKISGVYNGSAFQTQDIAFDGNTAAIQSALSAATGSERFAATRSGAVITITGDPIAGNVGQFTSTNTFTGGTTPGITHATTTSGVADGGKWAPYDSTKSDGRQTLTRSQVGIVNFTIKDSESVVLGADTDADLIGLITGGLVWRERLHVGGTNEPTLANLLVALPRLELTPAE